MLSSFFFFLVQSVKGIKDGWKKAGITLDSNFLGGGAQFSSAECFPELVEIAMFFLTRRLKNVLESSLASYQFVGSPYVSVFSGYVQLRLLSSGLSRHVPSLPAAERNKRVCVSEVIKAFKKDFFFGRQEAHLFSHAPISLPVRGLLRNCYFFIYSFIFWIPTHYTTGAFINNMEFECHSWIGAMLILSVSFQF